MDIIQAIILGIIQGLTEFLPVSSSGHLLLAQKLLHVAEPGLTMSILLHLGTLAAVLIVFWRDWWEMIKNPFKSHVFWMLVAATIPTAIVAVLFMDLIEQQSSQYSSGIILGISFLFTAILLLVAETFPPKRAARGKHGRIQDVGGVTLRHALVMGGMQAVAVLPGVSRSGATMTGGLFAGLPRTVAAKFSFMMSVPAILGSLVFDLKDVISGESTAMQGGFLAPLAGVLVSGVVGYLAIRWMLRLLQKVSLRVFSIYVSVVGILVLLDSIFFHLFF